MVYASEYSHHLEDAKGYGWSIPGEPSFDWGALKTARDAEIDRLEGIYGRLLDGSDVTRYGQHAHVVDAHTVQLRDGTRISAGHILIATGGRPAVPSIDGVEHAIVSDDIFELEAQPKRVLCVGGGYISLEFACIFHGLGSQVTISNRSTLFRGYDDDVRAHLIETLTQKGMDIRLGVNPVSIEEKSGCKLVTYDDGSTIEVDAVLLATGRNPHTDGLGVENAGITRGAKGEIPVDEFSRTVAPSIYAVGDVTDRVQLTPVAIREGMAFAETVFNNNPTSPDHDLIATAIFTQPEIGTIGLTEAQAREQHTVDIYRSVFRPMVNILAGREERSLMKIVVDRDNDVVLGVHLVGPHSGEMIQCVAIAVKMGATKADFDRTMAVHPTAAEELVTMRSPVADD
jgi:glutathione reductase (NADPH)